MTSEDIKHQLIIIISHPTRTFQCPIHGEFGSTSREQLHQSYLTLWEFNIVSVETHRIFTEIQDNLCGDVHHRPVTNGRVRWKLNRPLAGVREVTFVLLHFVIVAELCPIKVPAFLKHLSHWLVLRMPVGFWSDKNNHNKTSLLHAGIPLINGHRMLFFFFFLCDKKCAHFLMGDSFLKQHGPPRPWP